ncbi:MAG: hypothetical protein LUI13_06715 [Lachnospiraceae bacterium]|nr:hypothetical protein [Lachnospiraceae bacterium]
MSIRKTEAAYQLGGGTEYLHMKEEVDGFSYSVFRAGQPFKVSEGKVYFSELDQPVRNPLAEARTLAFRNEGLDKEPVAEVSLLMLERFIDSDICMRRIQKPETLPEHDIRFITGDYAELFRLPDGGTILVEYPDRQFAAKCEYVDEYHTRINGQTFHICQFAELLQRNNGSCRPEPEIMQEKAGWRIGSRNYLEIHAEEGTWAYTLYDGAFHEVADGRLDRPEMSMREAREMILSDMKMESSSRTGIEYGFLMEMTKTAAWERESVLGRLQNTKTGLQKSPAAAPRRESAAVSR